ncbi:GGDEF domain-containing protein [Aestuariibacter halophilus]|uniref:diguanylate cyclase n=1 Tax=Fluctibacter halophilus TaxID=226011 RepID=A0ABS8G9G3_9ALTE|nr:GGDEF domain-containing protein [Aestuariibacter halophilus]MCC2615856.1 GGDEF domain-containing protein [Aestuariibacter halophilus]
MQALRPIATRTLVPSLAFVLTLTASFHFSTLLQQWLSSYAWVPLASLVASGLISLQFGRTRLVFTALLLGAYYYARFHLSPLGNSNLDIYADALILLLAWLAWRPDKGVHPFNVVITVIELVLVGGLCVVLLPQLGESMAPVLTTLYAPLYQLNPTLAAMLSPTQWLVYIAVFVIGLVRVILVPSNSQIALWFTVIGLMVANAIATPLVSAVIITWLALAFVISTLVDSFNMAFRDELTGIPSRRALMQYVQTLGRRYIVVMCDIDHFKKFNDTYGHDVGDQVLRLVASKFNQVSGGGRAFRYGGEEFTLIFPRKDLHDVLPHVDLLRQTIEQYPLVIRSKDRPTKPPKKGHNKKSAGTKTVSVTCSFGVAQRTSEVRDFMDILKVADQALYQAKKAGRNCVKAAQQ